MKYAALAIALLIPTLAFAQLDTTSAPPLTLSLSPTAPQPGASAIVSPHSTLLDLTNATMTVTANGASIYSGNAEPVSVPIEGPGLTTTIKVTVSSGGSAYSKTLTIHPTDVSLVLEPLSSAPALYPGKPLAPQSGSVRIVAMADFRTTPTHRIDPDTLSYTWSADNVTLTDSSGIGRDAIILPVPLQYRSQTISVQVKSRDGTLGGSDSILLAPQTPIVRIYQNDPLSGILFDHALTNSYTIPGVEITLVGIPYSFSLSGGLPALTWALNGSVAQSGPDITLRPQGSGNGVASLMLTAAKGTSNESATQNVSLTFGGGSSNLFGL